LRRGYASWLKWKHDSKFIPITCEQSSGVSSTAGFRNDIPAQFTCIHELATDSCVTDNTIKIDHGS
jgi:hypothetical protein